jgi:hypothetical protein
MECSSRLKEIGTDLLVHFSNSIALLNAEIVRQRAHQNHTDISTSKGRRLEQSVSWRILSSGIQSVYCGEMEPTFRMNISLQSSWSKSKRSKNPTKNSAANTAVFRNVGWISPDYTAWYARRQIFIGTDVRTLNPTKIQVSKYVNIFNKIIFKNVFSNRPTFVKIYSII